MEGGSALHALLGVGTCRKKHDKAAILSNSINLNALAALFTYSLHTIFDSLGPWVDSTGTPTFILPENSGSHLNSTY